MQTNVRDRLLTQTETSQGSGLLDLRRRLNKTGPYARDTSAVQAQRPASSTLSSGGARTPRATQDLALEDAYVVVVVGDVGDTIAGKMVWPLMTADEVVRFVVEETGQDRAFVERLLPSSEKSGFSTLPCRGDDSLIWVIQCASKLPPRP